VSKIFTKLKNKKCFMKRNERERWERTDLEYECMSAECGRHCRGRNADSQCQCVSWQSPTWLAHQSLQSLPHQNGEMPTSNASTTYNSLRPLHTSTQDSCYQSFQRNLCRCQMPFMTPHQRCHRTEGKQCHQLIWEKISISKFVKLQSLFWTHHCVTQLHFHST